MRKLLLGLLACLWATCATATITVTDLGAIGGQTGGTSLSLFALHNCPAGSLIVVVAYEFTNTSSEGTVSDSQGNSYNGPAGGTNCVCPANSCSTEGYTCIYYVGNAAALTGGTDTITFHRVVSGSSVVFDALCATGIQKVNNPADTSSFGNFGTSTTPTATTASAPLLKGELHIGWVGASRTGAISWTQDSTNGSWATPPDASFGSNAANIFGGWWVPNDKLTHTYAPTMSTTNAWGERIFTFKPAASVGFIMTPAIVP